MFARCGGRRMAAKTRLSCRDLAARASLSPGRNVGAAARQNGCAVMTRATGAPSVTTAPRRTALTRSVLVQRCQSRQRSRAGEVAFRRARGGPRKRVKRLTSGFQIRPAGTASHAASISDDLRAIVVRSAGRPWRKTWRFRHRQALAPRGRHRVRWRDISRGSTTSWSYSLCGSHPAAHRDQNRLRR